MARSITVKVPGKLMIAGEFAVLEPYQDLAVMAVNRFVYATISEADSHQLTLSDFSLHNVPWTWHETDIHIESDDARLSFVKEALRITYRYMEEKGMPIRPMHVSTRSELDDASGVKYGLGSSAAIVTSIVAGVLHFQAPALAEKDTIFRLSALSHVITQGNGSGADIAASTYGGLLQFSSFQADWLLEAYQEADSITEVVEKDWKYYKSKPITLPANVCFCVGWTGSAASTKDLVNRVRLLKINNAEAYAAFLKDSENAVSQFLTGAKNNDINQLFQGIKANRKALDQVGKAADTKIETPDLAVLCNIAENLGGAGKPSGAGGGDCGIAFMPSEETAEQLALAWEEAGIKALTLSPFIGGETVVEEDHSF
ncbi:phosphomevalonate kinase [Oceanobacillus jeddahense]|uniref:phosphomevalonate kinase n=1 Tax=Oceanobacillus jeddahense TaxID=1462527 RepID=A0ABY5JSU5_9BACI|nr:phosphomevalonate kinase [Oceanobacillus jeddahense]UUI03407.1 phosphomevalonate kinase [Oceanobacillus jeddahense]